jgi:hypothetical protein
MCKTKWSGVCLLVFSFNPPLINGDVYFQIKSTYNLVKTYRNQSGVSWDNEHGAGIDESSASVWAEYIAIEVSNLAWFCLCASFAVTRQHAPFPQCRLDPLQQGPEHYAWPCKRCHHVPAIHVNPPLHVCPSHTGSSHYSYR